MFEIVHALSLPLGCFLYMNVQRSSPIFLIYYGLLFWFVVLHCIIFLLYFLNISKCFYCLALQEENILVKNYAAVVQVNVTKYFCFCPFKQMIHNYMEHLERTKLHQLTGGDQLESTTHSRIR